MSFFGGREGVISSLKKIPTPQLCEVHEEPRWIVMDCGPAVTMPLGRDMEALV